jgi:hypothetical protein
MDRPYEVELELVRPGPPHNQLLSPLTRYMGLCGDGSPVTFEIALEHRQLLNRLERLRYLSPSAGGGVSEVPEHLRDAEVLDLGREMGEILSRIPSLTAELNRSRASASDDDTGGRQGFVHLRLVLSGSELSLLPFELAVAPQSFPGEGLKFCLEGSLPVVLTREVRRSRPLPVSWGQHGEPRILFVSAEPQGLTVPKQAHVQALRAALEPWVEWPKSDGSTGPPVDRASIERTRLPSVKNRLRVLTQASIEDIYDACAAGDYSHVHILAHGDHRKHAGEDRFGLALAKHGRPGEREVVDGESLAQALLAARAVGGGRSQPVVVTLATCDSGQTGSVLVPGGGIAHDLHSAGIPWVFASQFPLTKRGSVRMTEFLYPRLLRGDDPRQVLYELRRYLHMTRERDHDWASIVAYSSFQRDFARQVETYFERQTILAIEVQMAKADAITEGRAPIERREKDGGDPRAAAVAAAVSEVGRLLDQWEQRLPQGESMDARRQRTTCFGIRGSVLKRFGLLFGSQKQYEKAREELQKAMGSYRKAMSQWATDGDRFHWTATQYLCLSAVLESERNREMLTLSRSFAERDLNDADRSLRAWAHGTLAELELLRLWHEASDKRERASQSSLKQVAEKVVEHCREIIKLMGADSFHVTSTRRQFQNYQRRWNLAKDMWGHEEWFQVIESAIGELSHSMADASDR